MRRWPAVGAAAATAAYGGLKLSWALGGGFLLAQAPLPPQGIVELQSRGSGVIEGHWLSVALAAVGFVAVFVLGRPVRRFFPRWFVLGGTWLLAALMFFRAVSQLIGGAMRLTMHPPPALRQTITWDLALWSPFFLVWGVCWALAAWQYGRATRRRRPESLATTRLPTR
jgi:Protein of unknown function (DUF3995)